MSASGDGRSHGTILVVEDEEVVRRVARASLEHAGFQVVEASDGMEALQQFAVHRHGIALVLLDLDLPVMNGIEVLRALRDEGCQASVLVASGFSEMEVKHRFRGVPISGVIEKPFRSNQLVDRVRELL